MEYRKTDKTKKKKPKEFELAKAKLANAFYILSERLVKGFKFQLIDTDDALQEGVLIGFEKLHHFDSSKGKAFSFYTQIILNHFKQLYRHAKGFNELKMKYTEFLINKDNTSAKKGKIPPRNSFYDNIKYDYND